MGISRSSVQRYCDTGVLRQHRTLGGHRRVYAEDVGRWLKESRAGKPLPKRKVFRAGRYTPEYIANALLQGKIWKLDSLLDQVVLNQNYYAGIFDHYLIPAIRVLSDRQRKQEITFAEQRVATSNLRFVLSHLPNKTLSDKAQVAVGGTLFGDHDEIESMMIERLLGDLNFQARHIGSHLPASALAQIAHQMHASLIWVSYCKTQNIQQMIDANRELQESLQPAQRLVVTGSALTPQIAQDLKFDFAAQSAQSLVNWLTSNA